MTLTEIAKANGQTLEEFVERCYKWKYRSEFPPTATIREDVRILAAHGVFPSYVTAYLSIFSTQQVGKN